MEQKFSYPLTDSIPTQDGKIDYKEFSQMILSEIDDPKSKDHPQSR